MAELLIDDRGGGPLLKTARNKIMAIKFVPPQGEKNLSRFDRTAISRKTQSHRIEFGELVSRLIEGFEDPGERGLERHRFGGEGNIGDKADRSNPLNY